jgi:hypothetical protein
MESMVSKTLLTEWVTKLFRSTVWIPLIASILFWGQSVRQAATRRQCPYRLIGASTEVFF